MNVHFLPKQFTRIFVYKAGELFFTQEIHNENNSVIENNVMNDLEMLEKLYGITAVEGNNAIAKQTRYD